MFSRLENFEIVKSVLADSGLQLTSENNAYGTLWESMEVKYTKRMDQIFKLLDMKANKERVLEALEPQKNIINSCLFWHQKEGLGWLVSRENSSELPAFWEEKDGVYLNELNNNQTNTRPEPLRGGIFTDDMGLGKILTLLSLIALDVSKIGKVDDLEPKTTLIVCPLYVYSSWLKQLEEHTRKDSLRVYLYYRERTKDVKELQKYGIVLTTYNTLFVEATRPKPPLEEIVWRRVILDEAHEIKKANYGQFWALIDLKTEHRWVVTGMPMQNSSFDLFSLVRFLRVNPLDREAFWDLLIHRPLGRGDDEGISRLQVLIAAISLRRRKDEGLVGLLHLPSKIIHTVYVDLGEHERKLYDQMEMDAKRIVKEYALNKHFGRNYFTFLRILVRLRLICTYLGLCPIDLRDLLPSIIVKDLQKKQGLIEKLSSDLQDEEDCLCTICMSPPNDAIITSCAHIFCEPCIQEALTLTPRCPLCRRPLSESKLFKPLPEPIQTIPNEGPVFSSKVATLLILLSASRNISPFSKSVIFSQFINNLLLLENTLTEVGFKVIRLDRYMSDKKRAKVIEDFDVPAPVGPTILLASLQDSYAQINLTAASTVYFLEPYWNPAVEERAVDRVHQLGQKNDVTIVKLIARDTVEERILQLQEKNKKKALAARKGKDFKKMNRDFLKEISNDDLKVLMKL